MSYFIDICFICLKHCNNLVRITSRDTNGTNFEDKLKYFLPGLELQSNIPKYICAKCGENLNKIREFKQICLRNITTYEKYAQQITTTDSSYKYLSVSIQKTAISNKNDYNINIQESQTEIEIEEFIIKEEINEELVLDDEAQLLLLEIKEEKTESNDDQNKMKQSKYPNENIEETAQVSNGSLSLLNENKIISEQCYDKKLHECEICNKSFRKLKSLSIHKRIHTNEKSRTCEICNKLYQYTYTCEVCNKVFQNLYNLNSHRVTHTGEKPYTCEICEKSFSRLGTLRQHKRTHTDDKPFTCEICKKSFRRMENLKEHKLLHTGEKPFTCEVCDKSFTYSRALKIHKLLHTDEKPFTCEVCNKSFRHSHVLKKHKLVHNPHQSKNL